VGAVAGCYVTDGHLERNARVRLLRDEVVIFDGKISSLKRFKEDVKEVSLGYECGLGLDHFQDIKPGDVFEAYELEEVKAEL
jgi:translation initiation factor IF-2